MTTHPCLLSSINLSKAEGLDQDDHTSASPELPMSTSTQCRARARKSQGMWGTFSQVKGLALPGALWENYFNSNPVFKRCVWLFNSQVS
jgi:hypothetical protein